MYVQGTLRAIRLPVLEVVAHIDCQTQLSHLIQNSKDPRSTTVRNRMEH